MTKPSSSATYTAAQAGNKIDEMLQFLKDAVYRERAQQLTLEGKLNDCRHLIEMEEYDLAKQHYHSAIIEHLDPKWTGSLLEEISGVLEKTERFETPSEKNPEMVLSQEQAMAEVNSLLAPITSYSAGNIPLENGMKRFSELLKQREEARALEVLQRTLKPHASENWIRDRSERIEKILAKRNPSLADQKNNPKPAVAAPVGDILYFKEDMEGRSIERLRLMVGHELMTYKKVTHRWGGVYYFTNDEPSKDTEWLRVWRLYERQQASINSPIHQGPDTRDF